MKKIIIILTTIAVILTSVVIYLLLQIDEEGPKIIIGEPEKEYTSDMSESDLLSDVTAMDEKDGDVTDSLFIQDILSIEKENAVIVMYSAMDHSHNLSSYKRKMIVKEIDKSVNEINSVLQETLPVPNAIEEPKEVSYPFLTLTTNEITKSVGESFYFGDYIKEVKDDKDDVAFLWRRISVRMDENFNMSSEGEYQITYLVTDLEGNRSEAETLTLKVVANNE